MMKKIIKFIILISIILIPNIVFAEDVNSILLIVDELSIETIEELYLEQYSIGFVNLKTRPPYSEEGLFLSINTGRKLSIKNFGKKDKKIDYLSDILKKENVSYIGEGKGNLIIGNREGIVDYSEDSIIYSLNWLVEKTDNLLNKSDVLVLEYDLKQGHNRIEILNQYLNHYKNEQIIVLPKAVATEDKYLLNKYLVPIIHINKGNHGLLTSSSTKREGFIALEDISAQIKETYGYKKKIDIGKPFKSIESDNPKKEIEDIYKKNMNLLIAAYLFHGLIYFVQVLLGVWILKAKKIEKWLYTIYSFVSTNIFTSLLLGLFEFHKNIFIYLIINLLISYLITRLIIKRKLDLVKLISIFTYALVVFGTCLYPKMIYNSYIGFNNLVYGARYYGLNNGIMGVLLVTSILSFFSITKSIESDNLKRFIGLFIFIINMITLSTYFGANTGGFITSVVLFGLMIYRLFFSNKEIRRYLFLFFLIGIFIFSLNIIFDDFTGENTHAFGFFYRLKENGISELISLASFKAKELFKLTILPPFSIVLIFQAIILNKLRRIIRDTKEIKEEAMIIFITSLVGFALNDTGVITLIYMIHYLVLDIISNRLKIE
ncbi:hypothetical protein CIW83_12470 [Tissierella sp. P1]|uniref:hypothetical protein n=1 Tax=unclassified Tissierella TaxID=2638726 RepID=UPI000BA0C86B|nr:hypothetical protein [Tissierella sp. P1]OZV11850.1 hypothetical protein CIW83_12470 [Tissierella sp. P1]